MSREWEVSYERRYDLNENWMYERDTRDADAREARRFEPNKLEEWELRHGHTRMFMQVEDQKYLAEHYRVRNSYEGLLD